MSEIWADAFTIVGVALAIAWVFASFFKMISRVFGPNKD